jgi:hypothetical protein
MAMDNVATMGKISYDVIKKILERFCPDNWSGCFEKDRHGVLFFSMAKADEVFKENIPQKLCDWLRLIHNLGNKNGRHYVEREAKLYKFNLEGKRKPGECNDRDYIGWLLLHDDKKESTFEFLERASFHRDTEKRSVYAIAKSRKKHAVEIKSLSPAQIEEIRLSYAERLLKKRRIVQSKIKAVRALPFVEGDRVHIVIRYPGARGAQVGCTDDGDWKSYVFSPACWVDFIVYSFNGNILIDMNAQEKDQEHYTNIRIVLGEILLGDPNAFRQVDEAIKLAPIGKKTLKEIFNVRDENGEQIKNLEYLHIHSVEYSVFDNKLQKHIIRRVEPTERGINLLKSDELAFMEFSEDPSTAERIQDSLLKVVIHYKVYTEASHATLELSMRGEKKYPQRHAYIIEPWLNAKGFSAWMHD